MAGDDAAGAGPIGQPKVFANTHPYLADSDGDFLPDVVEWAVLTNAGESDTDHDGIDDFVEVAQFGDPLSAGGSNNQDHELRTVVTVQDDPVQGEVVWMHFLFRFMGTAGQTVQLTPWIDVQGVRVPFDLQFGSNNVFIEQRSDPQAGDFAIVSARLLKRDVFQSLMPCMLGADAQIGTRSRCVGTYLFDFEGECCHLVPVTSVLPTASDGFAIQNSGSPQQDKNPFANSNKLCVMQLRRIGSAPGGALYVTHDPNCEEASGLECSTRCPETEGWTLTLPDGLAPLTGAN